MRKKLRYLFFTIILSACSQVPISGRKQVNLLPEGELMGMSLTNYRDFLSKHKLVSSSDPNAQKVKIVGAKISKAVEEYFQQKNLSKRIKGYKWEYNLVEDKAVNAWCMPGGKVVFYTGIMPVTKDEAGIAVVMGHEIAHAVARHGNERMSQQLLVQLGGAGLSLALSEKPKETQDIFLLSYGVGSTLGVLKYSRTHESEADKLGLVFMAMAGYSPSEAVGFWERMAKLSGGNVPELISTHPSDEKRIREIKEFLPIAMKYYKGK